ncbi:MAG: hypothetical protein A3K67_01810 [Euryarchaeota archaeon RBG_16_62_10]|nr:MAG: hypothetical protein A3K67_01810 [Euryarchaeota archaeon RBG_16_62_10]
MVRARVHEVCEAELVHAVQPLQLRRFQEGQRHPLEPDAPVDRVVDDLVVSQRRVLGMGAY